MTALCLTSFWHNHMGLIQVSIVVCLWLCYCSRKFMGFWLFCECYCLEFFFNVLATGDVHQLAGQISTHIHTVKWTFLMSTEQWDHTNTSRQVDVKSKWRIDKIVFCVTFISEECCFEMVWKRCPLKKYDFVGHTSVEVFHLLSLWELACKHLKSKLLRKWVIRAFCPMWKIYLCSLLSKRMSHPLILCLDLMLFPGPHRTELCAVWWSYSSVQNSAQQI